MAEVRSRVADEVRDRAHRVRIGFRLAVQAAVAAGLAWFVAHDILHHVQPFFAPIAAIVVLAVSVGHRLRRAAEVVAGNAVGILLGEALIIMIGRGAWQVAFAVLLAILTAIFVAGSPPLTVQAASSAALVATLIPPQGDYYFSRFVDAVVGGTVGLVVMAVLLPLNPLTVVERAAGPVLDALARGLIDTADAMENEDRDTATQALDDLRDAEEHLRAFSEANLAGKEISTMAPLRWRKRGVLAQYLESYNHIARALRNSRVLVRRAVTMVSDGEPIPPALTSAVRSLAESVEWLRRELRHGHEPAQARAAALRAVRACAEAYGEGLGFSGGVVVAQIRSTASDLITASGLSPEEAHRQVRAVRPPMR